MVCQPLTLNNNRLFATGSMHENLHSLCCVAGLGEVYSSIYLPAAARPAGADWSRMASAAPCDGSPSKRLAWARATGGWAGSKRHRRNVQSLVRTRQAPDTISVTSATLYLVKISHRVPPHLQTSHPDSVIGKLTPSLDERAANSHHKGECVQEGNYHSHCCKRSAH